MCLTEKQLVSMVVWTCTVICGARTRVCGDSPRLNKLEPRRSGDDLVAHVRAHWYPHAQVCTNGDPPMCSDEVKNNCSCSIGRLIVCTMYLDSIAINVPLKCIPVVPVHAAINSRRYTKLNFIFTDPLLSLHIHVQLKKRMFFPILSP